MAVKNTWSDGDSFAAADLNAIANAINGFGTAPTGTVVGTTDTQTLTNKTLTSPKIGTSILDTNGNSLVSLTATGSAVNYVSLSNAATTGFPIIAATGSDTNVSLSLQTKGTGTVSINGVNVATVSDTQTLTNKRITPRIGTVASSATPSINTDSYDQYNITALATAITGVTITGTPTDGQKLLVRIKDNGTAQTLTWGSSFASSGSVTLLTTTVAGKTHLSGFIYDSVASKWICVAADSAGY